MVHARLILALGVGFATLMSTGCSGGADRADEAQETDTVAAVVEKTTVSSKYLLSLEEVERATTSPEYAIIDLRKDENYAEGHVPGAVSVWRPDIQNLELEYGGMMAPKEKIEELFGSLGIATGTKVIIYDEKGLVDAARLWWILQYYGYEESYMFDGGLTAWKESGLALETEAPAVEPAEFVIEGPQRPDLLATKEMVEAALSDDHIMILDTRSEIEFTGGEMKSGAFRAGHIPGALWIDYCRAIEYNGNQHFLSVEDLQELYGSVGLEKDMPIIVYCHSGVRSAHTTFVLRELLGFSDVRNYDGSWTEWSYYSELPIVADSTNNAL